MAEVQYTPLFLRIELDHEETTQLVTLGGTVTAASVTGLLTAFGIASAAAGIVGAAVALHAAWQLPLIKSRDQGNGVILTVPMLGVIPIAGAVVIPYTRYAPDNAAWSSKAKSTIGSTDGDIIETTIEPGDNTSMVTFVLSNQVPSGWHKAMVLRDGLGQEWWGEAKGFSRVEGTLPSETMGNGQPITFWKPKQFGVWTEIFSVRELEQIKPGSKVTFTWVDDDGP